jgi:peptidoglycan/LPS O-acetylase OafA/YrhL
MTDNRLQKHSYMTGLDGLRALAVFAVIGFHLSLPFTPGGFLGVTLFFALSGYLITDILSSEWARETAISLGKFYIRRAKRLLPGVLFLLACLTLCVVFFRPELLTNLKSAFMPALLFYSNWWYILSGTPYFSTSSVPSLLNHFWSLAVEAQFYLVWPVLLIALQRLIRKKWVLVAVTAALAVLSAVLMGVLYQPFNDPSRVYYGTDTRIFSLLLGACLAFVCPSRKITQPLQSKKARILLDVSGILALGVILAAMVYATQYDDFLYQGGMFAFSAVSLVLIAAAANPSTVIGRIFSLKPLRFVGNISYGMYLWQFPVIVISNAVVQSNSVNVLLCIGQVAATILLAAVSYYLIEKPVRKSGVLESAGNVRMKFSNAHWPKKSAVLLVTCLFLAAGIILAKAKPAASAGDAELVALPSELHIDAPAPSESSPEPALPSQSPEVSPVPPEDPSVTDVQSSTSSYTVPDNAAQAPEADVPPPEEIVPSDLSVTMIGDSIGIDVLPYLQKYYPNMNVEAEVGRQFYEAKNIITDLIKNNKLADTVIIELGSNGTVKESSLRDIIELIGSDRKIVLVNTQVPRSWCADVNATLAKVSAEYANTTVADWYSASINKSDYFYKDAVHPNKTGSPVMAQVIADAVSALQEN